MIVVGRDYLALLVRKVVTEMDKERETHATAKRRK